MRSVLRRYLSVTTMYFVNTQPSLIYIETAYLMQIDHNYYRRPLAMLLNTHMSENVFPSQIFFGFLLTESYLHFTAACFHIRKQVKYEVKIKEEITYILWGHGNGDSASPTHHPQQTCFSSPTGWWCPRQLYNLLKLTNPHHNQLHSISQVQGWDNAVVSSTGRCENPGDKQLVGLQNTRGKWAAGNWINTNYAVCQLAGHPSSYYRRIAQISFYMHNLHEGSI